MRKLLAGPVAAACLLVSGAIQASNGAGDQQGSEAGAPSENLRFEGHSVTENLGDRAETTSQTINIAKNSDQGLARVENGLSDQKSESSEQRTNEEILRYADNARGGGMPGLKWDVSVKSTSKSDRTEEFELEVSAASGNWIAEFKEPRNALGNKLLKIGDNMWFTKRNLRKPVPISQRQRLTGSAANGDIASTNYVKDYTATRLPNEEVDGETLFVFDLKANDSSVTYDRVKYWISAETGLGVEAEFYTSAGKLLKSATFEYGNSITVDSRKQPFISRMIIQDEISQAQKSVLEYSAIEIKSIPNSHFRL